MALPRRRLRRRARRLGARAGRWPSAAPRCSVPARVASRPPALGGDGCDAAPGIDPLEPAQHRARRGCPAAWCARSGIDLERPFACQVMRLDRWKDPHAGARGVPRSRARSPTCSSCSRRCSTGRQRRLAGARRRSPTTPRASEGVLLLTSYEGLGSLELGALQRLARVRLAALAARGLRPGRLRGAVEAHAGDRRPGRRRAAAGARRRRRLPDRRRRGRPRRACVELVRDPGARGRDGPRRPRARARALPRHARRSRASSRLLAEYRSGGMKVTLPDGTELELPDGATGADAAARDRRGPGPRGARASRWTASCATCPRRSPTARASRSSPPRDDDGLWLIRHDAAHVLADGGDGALPGRRRSRSARRSRTASTTTSSSPRA